MKKSVSKEPQLKSLAEIAYDAYVQDFVFERFDWNELTDKERKFYGCGADFCTCYAVRPASCMCECYACVGARKAEAKQEASESQHAQKSQSS
jgi:hypothetical protein